MPGILLRKWGAGSREQDCQMKRRYNLDETVLDRVGDALLRSYWVETNSSFQIENTDLAYNTNRRISLMKIHHLLLFEDSGK